MVAQAQPTTRSSVQFWIFALGAAPRACPRLSGNVSWRSGRAADAYVFCVFKEKDAKRTNVLDQGQWDFYVVATGQIEDAFGDQKSLSLNSLGTVAKPVDYGEIRQVVEGICGI